MSTEGLFLRDYASIIDDHLLCRIVLVPSSKYENIKRETVCTFLNKDYPKENIQIVVVNNENDSIILSCNKQFFIFSSYSSVHKVFYKRIE